MGDEYDRAEEESWGAQWHAPLEDDDRPQPRSFLNPGGHSKSELHRRARAAELLQMPEIRVNRGGIQFHNGVQYRGVTAAAARVIMDETQHFLKENDMRSTEDILAEAQAARDEAARLEAIVEQREKLGSDPFKNGSVLKIDMKYRTGNRSYAYAVVKIGGKFYFSGKMGAVTNVTEQGKSWDEFVAWLSQGDATVWQAKSLQRVL